MDDARLREAAADIAEAIACRPVEEAVPILRSLLREVVAECEEAANGIAFPLAAIRERFAWLGGGD